MRNRSGVAVALTSCGIALCGVAATAAAQPTSTGSGQAFPSKPIQFLVSFPPGSGTDLAARLVEIVRGKEAGHRIGQADFVQPARSMSCIGG